MPSYQSALQGEILLTLKTGSTMGAPYGKCHPAGRCRQYPGAERLNIQMDNGQTECRNTTLTHSLQQPAQKTNPASTVTSPGSQLLAFRKQTCKKSDYDP